MKKVVALLALLLIAAAPAFAEDWPMWGRTPERHMRSPEKNPPTTWDIEKGTNIKWASQLGSQSYANPVVYKGLVFVGTNNEAKRDPKITEDAGVLMIFRESDGKFLYQRTSPKLKAGRVNDWPYQGICSTVCAEGDFIWFCTNRCEVVCLDVSPLRQSNPQPPKEVWVCDMMASLGVFPHNMTSCSPAVFQDYVYIITANGQDESHKNVPSPKAPSVVCFNKKDGKVIWTDNSPGEGILHGEWSSPTIINMNGHTQVICPLGDSWVRSFDALTGTLLWKFDTNIKDSVYPTVRNELIATAVVEGNLMYIATGQDPEHGEGPGHMWCVDISKGHDGNDLSLELDPPLPSSDTLKEGKSEQVLVINHKGIPNPNSAVVWHFDQKAGANGKVTRKDRMNRTISTCAIADGMCIAPDFSGFVHVFDAKTGERLWTYDMEAAMWGSPLIADGKIFVCNEEGKVVVFELSRTMKKIEENDLGSASYCSPVFANGVLYVTSREKLFAIANGANSAPAKE